MNYIYINPNHEFELFFTMLIDIDTFNILFFLNINELIITLVILYIYKRYGFPW